MHSCPAHWFESFLRLHGGWHTEVVCPLCAPSSHWPLSASSFLWDSDEIRDVRQSSNNTHYPRPSRPENDLLMSSSWSDWWGVSIVSPFRPGGHTIVAAQLAQENVGCPSYVCMTWGGSDVEETMVCGEPMSSFNSVFTLSEDGWWGRSGRRAIRNPSEWG